jgi:hypothetical protein
MAGAAVLITLLVRATDDGCIRHWGSAPCTYAPAVGTPTAILLSTMMVAVFGVTMTALIRLRLARRRTEDEAS